MAVIDLVTLTSPDGKYLAVAPANIVALRGRAPGDHGLLHGGVHCVVYTSDGKFLSVVESCNEVRSKIQTATVTNPHMGPVQEIPP